MSGGESKLCITQLPLERCSRRTAGLRAWHLPPSGGTSDASSVPFFYAMLCCRCSSNSSDWPPSHCRSAYAEAQDVAALVTGNTVQPSEPPPQLQQAHASQLEQLQQVQRSELALELEELQEAHAAQLEQLEQAHASQLELVRATFAREAEELRRGHLETIASITGSHVAELEELKAAHAEEAAVRAEEIAGLRADLQAVRVAAAAAAVAAGTAAAAQQGLGSEDRGGDAGMGTPGGLQPVWQQPGSPPRSARSTSPARRLELQLRQVGLEVCCLLQIFLYFMYSCIS